MRNLMACILVLVPLAGCGCGVVDTGNRGVLVHFGKADSEVLPEGLQFYQPIGTSLNEVSVRQQKKDMDAPCFSSDLQQVGLKVSVLYRIPEASVVQIFKDFHGDPFDVLVAPRVQESIKEATATRSAEMIVKERESVKTHALEAVRLKVGSILVIEDLIIADVKLSEQLSVSIEAKMIQEQKAQQAKYTKLQAETEAQIAVEIAKGVAEANLTTARAEAESIRIRGEAIANNPGVIQLQMIQRWNGISPQIVSGGTSGVNLLLPSLKQ